MRQIKEVLRLKLALGLSDAVVSRGARVARSTVREYLVCTAAAGLNWETAERLGEEELDRRLFAISDGRDVGRPLPDWEVIEKELRGRLRPALTRAARGALGAPGRNGETVLGRTKKRSWRSQRPTDTAIGNRDCHDYQ
jgi:hypothetical protein